MSWQTYVDDHLLCEIEGNHLTHAAIIGHDGSVWAQSSQFPQVFVSIFSYSFPNSILDSLLNSLDSPISTHCINQPKIPEGSSCYTVQILGHVCQFAKPGPQRKPIRIDLDCTFVVLNC